MVTHPTEISKSSNNSAKTLTKARKYVIRLVRGEVSIDGKKLELKNIVGPSLENISLHINEIEKYSKKRINSSFSSKSTEAKQVARQGIEQILPLKQT